MNEATDDARHCVAPLELTELDVAPPTASSPGPAVAVLNEVDVHLDVRLGRTAMKVRDLLALNTGATVTLDQTLDQDVEVVLNGKVIALGALVAVDDRFGVQITRTFVSA